MNSKEDERSFFFLFKILLSFKISRKGLIVKKIILKNHSIQKLKKQDIAKV